MKKGPIYVLACYILWGLLPAFWKTMADVSPIYVLAVRIVWSLGFISLILLCKRGFGGVKAVFRDRRELLLLMAAGLVICINWGSFIWAVNSGHVLDSSLAYYLNPILSILIGTVAFHEKLTGLQWVSVGVTATGLLLTIVRYGHLPWIALIIGGSFAVYGVVKKFVRSDAATSMFMETLTLAPFALLYLLLFRSGSGIENFHGARWLLLPLAGIVTSVPLLFFAAGIRETSYTLSGILMYINPTLQLFTGVFFFGEKFTATHAILFGFVWSGLTLFLISNYLKRRKEAKPCVSSQAPHEEES